MLVRIEIMGGPQSIPTTTRVSPTSVTAAIWITCPARLWALSSRNSRELLTAESAV